MLSRVAENLYWFGRNLERVENISRMAEVSYFASVEAGGLDADPEIWDAVITATGGHGRFDEAREAQPSISPSEFLLLSTENPHSLRSTLNYARSLARQLREHLSRDVWEEINRLYLEVRRTSPTDGSGMADFYDSVRRSIAAIFGLFDNTVQLDEGRDWFRCGIFIERADMTSRIIDAKSYVVLPAGQAVGGSVDRVHWTSVLRSAGARQAFRMTHRAPPSGPRGREHAGAQRALPAQPPLLHPRLPPPLRGSDRAHAARRLRARLARARAARPRPLLAGRKPSHRGALA